MGIPFWRNALGIALVEFAGILLVLLPLVIGGIVVGDYVQSVSLVSGAVHTRVVDGLIGSTSTPVRASAVYRLSGSGLTLRTAELNQLVGMVRDALASDINGKFSGATSQDYVVEVGWAVLNVNTSSGQLTSARPAQVTVVTGGGLAAQHARTMTQEFEHFVQEALNADQSGQPSSLAIPLALYTGSGTNRFAAQSVLVGARVAVRSGSAAVRDTLSTFGISTTIHDFRAVHLRGDVS